MVARHAGAKAHPGGVKNGHWLQGIRSNRESSRSYSRISLTSLQYLPPQTANRGLFKFLFLQRDFDVEFRHTAQHPFRFQKFFARAAGLKSERSSPGEDYVQGGDPLSRRHGFFSISRTWRTALRSAWVGSGDAKIIARPQPGRAQYREPSMTCQRNRAYAATSTG